LAISRSCKVDPFRQVDGASHPLLYLPAPTQADREPKRRGLRSGAWPEDSVLMFTRRQRLRPGVSQTCSSLLVIRENNAAGAALTGLPGSLSFLSLGADDPQSPASNPALRRWLPKNDPRDQDAEEATPMPRQQSRASAGLRAGAWLLWPPSPGCHRASVFDPWHCNSSASQVLTGDNHNSLWTSLNSCCTCRESRLGSAKLQSQICVSSKSLNSSLPQCREFRSPERLYHP
jgi:hypothetical protein